MEDIVLSILVITYQHKKYISKALDSILMQKTSFRTEILVSDDCSTDGTREVLLEYKRRYGNRIHLILRNKNVGATKNAYYIMTKAKGKYICTLEGDDYWTDDLKLEKQVQYLDTHPGSMGVFHKCHVVGEYGNSLRIDYRTIYDSKEGYTLKDFQSGTLPGHTGTFMYRNIFKEKNGRYNFFYRIHNLVGDQTVYCILLSKGTFGYIDEDMSVYRKVVRKNGTNAASVSANNNNSFIMWKYFVDLELCMEKRLGVFMDLSMRRRDTLLNAYYKFKENMSVANFYIILKVFFMECIYTLIRSSALRKNQLKRG